MIEENMENLVGGLNTASIELGCLQRRFSDTNNLLNDIKLK